jgi:hypothetical protein
MKDGQKTKTTKKWTYYELSDYKYYTYRQARPLRLLIPSG